MDVKVPALRAVIVARERALPIKPFGIDMKGLLTTEATGGAISVILAWHKPGQGPPDHVHFSQEEMFFIVEGTYELTVGDQTSTVGPGTIAFIPRNVVHCRRPRACSTGVCRVGSALHGEVRSALVSASGTQPHRWCVRQP
jgi:quercetin dioxygenase-like cupin family protein